MTTLAPDSTHAVMTTDDPPDRLWRRGARSGRILTGGAVLLFVFLCCVLTLPWTARSGGPLYYDQQDVDASLQPPALHPLDRLFGTKPILTAVFVLLGGAAGVLNVWRLFAPRPTQNRGR